MVAAGQQNIWEKGGEKILFNALFTKTYLCNYLFVVSIPLLEESSMREGIFTVSITAIVRMSQIRCGI